MKQLLKIKKIPLKFRIISLQIIGLILMCIVTYFNWPLETWFHYYIGPYLKCLNPIYYAVGPTIVTDEKEILPTKWDMTGVYLWIITGIIPMLYAFIKKIHKKIWIIVLGLLPLLTGIIIFILSWILYYFT